MSGPETTATVEGVNSDVKDVQVRASALAAVGSRVARLDR